MIRGMARTETLVQLTKPLLDLLDRVAAERGVSRSQIIREAVAQYLDLHRHAQVDAAIVEGYRRRPPSGEELAWGERRRREAWSDLEW